MNEERTADGIAKGIIKESKSASPLSCHYCGSSLLFASTSFSCCNTRMTEEEGTANFDTSSATNKNGSGPEGAEEIAAAGQQTTERDDRETKS